MAEQDMPNRAANMEKAEGDRNEAADQQQPTARPPHPDDRTRPAPDTRNPVMPDDDAKLRTEI